MAEVKKKRKQNKSFACCIGESVRESFTLKKITQFMRITQRYIIFLFLIEVLCPNIPKYINQLIDSTIFSHTTIMFNFVLQ